MGLVRPEKPSVLLVVPGPKGSGRGVVLHRAFGERFYRDAGRATACAAVSEGERLWMSRFDLVARVVRHGRWEPGATLALGRSRAPEGLLGIFVKDRDITSDLAALAALGCSWEDLGAVLPEIRDLPVTALRDDFTDCTIPGPPWNAKCTDVISMLLQAK